MSAIQVTHSGIMDVRVAQQDAVLEHLGLQHGAPTAPYLPHRALPAWTIAVLVHVMILPAPMTHR